MLALVQAAQAKQTSAQDRKALQVSRMEGEEMVADLQRTQECLTSLQADLIPAEQAYHISAMLGMSWPNLSAVGAFSVVSGWVNRMKGCLMRYPGVSLRGPATRRPAQGVHDFGQYL